MVLERTRLGGASIDIERHPSEVPAETIPATMTDGRTDPTSTDSFVPVVGPALPEIAPRPAVGHPLFVCRDIPTDVSAMSLEEFTADFDCRLEVITSHIEAGRLDQASRLINELNATWRSFNAAHREIPQADRNRLLGRLYLAQASLERARGPQRETYALHFEARGSELTGDSRQARLRYREFLTRSEGTSDRYVSGYRRTSLERQRVLELAAVERLTDVAMSLSEQRGRHLVRVGTSGMSRFDGSMVFLGALHRLIESGRAATVEEATETLRADYLRSQREFRTGLVVGAGQRVHGSPEVTAARLEGGVFELRTAASSPRSLTVTVGRAGGVICLPGVQYYFPASDRELTVHLWRDNMMMLDMDDGARVPDVRSGSEIVRPGHGYYVSDSAEADARIPREVRAMRTMPHAVYDASGGSIHPNSLEHVFNTRGELIVDGFLQSVLEMETQEGMEQLTDESTRGSYLIEMASRMRSCDGSYGVASACLQEVFAAEFDRAVAYVRDHRSEEVSALASDDVAGLIELASQQMETWAESGELAESDPTAARAWSLYNDMMDPAGENFNVADEFWDSRIDEAIITGITIVATMGLGAGVEGAIVGEEVTAEAVAQAGYGVRALVARFGPRLLAGVVRAAVVDTPFMYEGGAILTGQHPTTEGALHTMVVMAMFHGVGVGYGGGAEVALGRTVTGRSLTAWAGDSAMRRMAIRGTIQLGAVGTMTTGATLLSDPSEGTLAERFATEGGRMLYMTALGAAFGSPHTQAGRPVLTLDLRMPDFARGRSRIVPDSWMIENLQPQQIVFIQGEPQTFVEARDGRVYFETPTGVDSVEMGADFMEGNFAELPIDSIRPTENGLSQTRLEGAADHLDEPINVYRHVDPSTGEVTFYALDGHHRLAAAAAEGRGTIRVRFDFHSLDAIQDRMLNDSDAAFPIPDGVAGLLVDPSRVDDYRGVMIPSFELPVTPLEGDDTMPIPMAARRDIPLEVPADDATNPAGPTARRRTPTAARSSERGSAGSLDDLDGAMDALARRAEQARAEREAAALAATGVAEGASEDGIPGVGTSPITFPPVDSASVRAMVRLGGVSIGTDLVSGAGEGTRVQVRVPGAEAEAAFLEALRAQPETTVEDLGEGRFRVRHERHGEAVVEVSRTTELTLAQQGDIGSWCDTLPTSEDQGWNDFTLYSRPRLESLVDHLISRGWSSEGIEGLFTERGFTAEASAEIVGSRVSRASRGVRSAAGAP